MTKPLEVKVGDNIEKALKDLKKKMGHEGVFKEIKKRRFYEKPSAKKKREEQERMRRMLKKIRRMQYKNKNSRSHRDKR